MIRGTGIGLLASVVLAACGGGAETTTNPQAPIGGVSNDAPYSGPVARDADVLKFQQTFWSNARTSSRCGSCHTPDGGQTPYFVRADDINMAYDEAVLKIDRSQPSLSEFVTKVETGHNCWVDDPGTCGAILTTWIENWVGGDAAGGREIILTGYGRRPTVFRDHCLATVSSPTLLRVPRNRRVSCPDADAVPLRH
jgi:hypothetical protein